MGSLIYVVEILIASFFLLAEPETRERPLLIFFWTLICSIYYYGKIKESAEPNTRQFSQEIFRDDDKAL